MWVVPCSLAINSHESRGRRKEGKKSSERTDLIFLVFFHESRILFFFKKIEKYQIYPDTSQPLKYSKIWSRCATSPGVPSSLYTASHQITNLLIWTVRSTCRSSQSQPHDLSIRDQTDQRPQLHRCTVLAFTPWYNPEHLSPLAGDSLSLLRSPISGHLKLPNHHRKVAILI